MKMNILSNGTICNDLLLRLTSRSINNTCFLTHSYAHSRSHPLYLTSASNRHFISYMWVATGIDKQNFLSILIENNDLHSSYH